ncbi:hypothetical protein HT031_000917 [Scenedesmus sp. PABB004]|nr:hypothetical protein HT031_000917 [Scenedesmus sp. PABB004]
MASAAAAAAGAPPPRSSSSCGDAWEEQLSACMLMAQAALHVKNSALETLASELAALQSENDQLVALAAAKGGDQVPSLLRSLAAARAEARRAQAEADALGCRLSEEVELRADIERELEDTAAAATELWESMTRLYPAAPDTAGGGSSQAESVSADEWGTPPGAASPLRPDADAAPQASPAAVPLAEAAAAAAAARAAAAAAPRPRTPPGAPARRLRRAARRACLPAFSRRWRTSSPRSQTSSWCARRRLAVARWRNGPRRAPAPRPPRGRAAQRPNACAAAPQGLVSWLDARDGASPASTPRSALGTPRSRASPAPGSGGSGGASGGARTLGRPSPRVAPLPLGLCSPAGGAAAPSGGLGSPLEGGSPDGARVRARPARASPRISPRLMTTLAAAVAAAADGKAAAGRPGGDAVRAAALDVARPRDAAGSPGPRNGR